MLPELTLRKQAILAWHDSLPMSGHYIRHINCSMGLSWGLKHFFKVHAFTISPMILGFNKKNLCVSAEGVRPFCNDQLAGLCENLRKCNKKGIFIGKWIEKFFWVLSWHIKKNFIMFFSNRLLRHSHWEVMKGWQEGFLTLHILANTHTAKHCF